MNQIQGWYPIGQGIITNAPALTRDEQNFVIMCASSEKTWDLTQMPYKLGVGQWVQRQVQVGAVTFKVHTGRLGKRIALFFVPPYESCSLTVLETLNSIYRKISFQMLYFILFSQEAQQKGGMNISDRNLRAMNGAQTPGCGSVLLLGLISGTVVIVFLSPLVGTRFLKILGVFFFFTRNSNNHI